MRLLGINIPDNKRIDMSKRAKDLNPDELNKIKDFIEKNYKVEGELRQVIKQNIGLLKDMQSYRGIRHMRRLPVRGQRTKTNSRTVRGNVYIGATYNNTIITVTDEQGNVLAWASAGSLGFSGPKKATPFAASKVVAALAEKLKKTGLMDVRVFVRGVGSGRDSALRSFANQGFNVLSVQDV